MQYEREDRRHALMATIAARLARVRGQMTDAEFGQLLADVVRTAERFAEIDAKPGGRLTPNVPPDEIRRLLDLRFS